MIVSSMVTPPHDPKGVSSYYEPSYVERYHVSYYLYWRFSTFVPLLVQIKLRVSTYLPLCLYFPSSLRGPSCSFVVG